LRERGEEIVNLAEELLRRVARRYGLKAGGIPAEGRRRLVAHRWPGNVRELAHEIERAVVLGGEAGLSFPHLGGGAGRGGSPLILEALSFPTDFVFPETGFSLERAIDTIVQRALRQAGGNVSGAARLLGVSRDVVRYRLKTAAEERVAGENSPLEGA